jgi:hypothetical protein
MLFFLCFSAAPKQYDSSGKHTYLKVCKQEGITQSQSFMRIIIISATWYFRIFLSFCCHRDPYLFVAIVIAGHDSNKHHSVELLT